MDHDNDKLQIIELDDQAGDYPNLQSLQVELVMRGFTVVPGSNSSVFQRWTSSTHQSGSHIKSMRERQCSSIFAGAGWIETRL